MWYIVEYWNLAFLHWPYCYPNLTIAVTLTKRIQRWVSHWLDTNDACHFWWWEQQHCRGQRDIIIVRFMIRRNSKSLSSWIHGHPHSLEHTDTIPHAHHIQRLVHTCQQLHPQIFAPALYVRHLVYSQTCIIIMDCIHLLGNVQVNECS